jgi:FkbM family methyltransferase
MINKINSALHFGKNYLKRRKLPYEKLQPGDIFIDCGANVGQETIPALKRGAIVYAFEPHPDAFKALRENVGKNNSAHLYQQGVWDRKTTMKLYLHENHNENAVKWSQGASFVEKKENVDISKFVEVEVIDLANFIKKLKHRVRILKIDVEGVEFDILKRLIDCKTYEQIDYVFAETHVDKMTHLAPQEAKIKQRIAKEHIKNIFLDWV